jgi:hypothetical protein
MQYNKRDRDSIFLNTTQDISNNEPAKTPIETSIANNPPMKLIPWADIWMSLKVARIRGNGEMIEVFYDTLFKEAVFDDNGAWALDLKNRF